MLWVHITKLLPACVCPLGLFPHIPTDTVCYFITANLINEKNGILFSNFAFFFYFLYRNKLLFPLFECLLLVNSVLCLLAICS